MTTERSPAVRIYRRTSVRLGPLRERLALHDFHPALPPDALAEWECRHDDGVRVRAATGIVLVEAATEQLADRFDVAHRIAFPSDGDVPDGGAAPERVEAIAGSDESGKAEADRALVVAAVLVPIAAEDELLAHGVRDSKRCSRDEVAALSRWIGRRFARAVERVEPDERPHVLREHGGNESRLLAALHARALSTLHGAQPFPLARVDRFAPGRPVAAALARTLPNVTVDECVRGERHVACAAASILARAATLRA